MARPFVTEIRENERVRGVFVVTRKSLLVTRNGSPYLSVTLADRTGEIEGRAWDDAERHDRAFERGQYVEVDAFASPFGGKLQLKVESIARVPEDAVDPRDFVASSRFDPELMWAELVELVGGVGDPHVRALLQAFLDDPELAARLRQAPAAKNVHHSFVGGLLEHTLSVMQLAHRIADHYPRADRDLLVAGAFLHDLGKVRELTWEAGALDYTTEGRLVGHLLLTVQWIREKAARLPDFPPALEMHLVHLVAAHHGQLEFGSPKVPHTLEAMLVHALDELDSRVQAWTSIFDRDRGEEWTEYQRLYDRFLFKGPGWGRERAGLGPAPHGRRWEGESLYRREVEGGAAAPEGSPPVPRGEAPPRRGREEKPRDERGREPRGGRAAEEAPPAPDLFSARRRSG